VRIRVDFGILLVYLLIFRGDGHKILRRLCVQHHNAQVENLTTSLKSFQMNQSKTIYIALPAGLAKTRVFLKKPSPVGFFWFYWVLLGFLEFIGFFRFSYY
jgi:hypothetical protein